MSSIKNMKWKELKTGEFFVFEEFDKSNLSNHAPQIKTPYSFCDVGTLFRYSYKDCYRATDSDTDTMSVTILSKEEVLSIFKKQIDEIEKQISNKD